MKRLLLFLMMITPAYAKDPATSCLISIEKFRAIKLGMTYQQVRDVIGCEGYEVMHRESGRQVSFEYKWTGGGSYPSYAEFEFENNKLTEKHHFDLVNE